MHVVGFLVFTLAVSTIFSLGGTTLMGMISLAYITFAAYHLYRNLMFNIKTYPTLYREWESSYLCLQCSQVFIP